MFKRALSLKDKLVSSHLNDNTATKHCEHVGTLKCGFCDIGPYINNFFSLRLPNGQNFKPKHFADCTTPGVVYLFQCECSCFYVGKTIRPFQATTKQQIYLINTGDLTTILGRHAARNHQYKNFNFSFYVLDRVHPHIRGDWDNAVLRSEAH